MYGKTLTHRVAGGGKLNTCNLNRSGPPTKKTEVGDLIVAEDGAIYAVAENDVEGARVRVGVEWLKWRHCHLASLRDCITAPEKHLIVAVDSSNIELRAGHYYAGQDDTVAAMREGRDLYCEFASDLYGYAVNAKDHPAQRQHGKVAHLQLEYGSGDETLRKAAKRQYGVIMTPDEAERTKTLYRTKFYALPAMWRRGDQAIRAMLQGAEYEIDRFGLCRTVKNAIILPNGMRLDYIDLHEEPDADFGVKYVYTDRETRKQRKLYGSKVFQNIIQALARIVVVEQMAAIEREFHSVVHHVYDENVVLAREDEAKDVARRMVEIMSTPPSWWPGLPVGAKAGIGVSYGDAK